MGADGKFDLSLAASQNPEATRAALQALASRPPHLPLSRALRALTSSPKSGRGGGRPVTVLTSRKSMSTTNLFEVRLLTELFSVLLMSKCI